MPITTLHPLSEIMVSAQNPTAASASGSRITLFSPVRGRLLSAGLIPNSLVTSAMTLAVLVGDNVNNLASSFATVITSTLGTFSSTLLFEGACCSVAPPQATYVNEGDAIQIVTSGGNSSAIGATCFAVINRA